MIQHRSHTLPGFLFALVLAIPPGTGLLSPLGAQELPIPVGHADQRVDRIAAVVGDSIIFVTDLEEQVLRIQASGGDVPTAAEARGALLREILEGMINEQLLLQAAARDTLVTVSDERVESTLRAAWDDEIRRWGTEAALREELNRSQGLSLTQYRAQIRERIRRDLTIQSYIQSHRREARPVAVTDAEVEAFFADQRTQLARRPATLSFRQVFIQPRPGEAAMAEARAEIERIFGLLREGQEFESLARQFSQDPGSRQNGGDLGWFRRGDGLVREFEDAAFSAREGAIVGPVETLFGAHLIQVERVRGAERRIRHILIGAEVGEADLERAREQAEEVRSRLSEGRSVREFTEAQRAQGYGESMEIAREQLAQLPESFARALGGAGVGEVVGPVEFALGPGQSAWAVFEVTGIREEGEYTVDDLRRQIRERLQVQKLEERMIADLRARTFVDIRI